MGEQHEVDDVPSPASTAHLTLWFHSEQKSLIPLSVPTQLSVRTAVRTGVDALGQTAVLVSMGSPVRSASEVRNTFS